MEKLPSAEELYKLYSEGMSALALAKKYNTTQGSVTKKMHRAGYSLRSLSDAHKLAYKTGRHIPTGAKGENHWAWKGGKERRQYRNKIQKELCDTCGSRQNLGIHHKDFDHYNNDPENLQVLCLTCHMSFHKKMYWDAKKNGKETPKGNGPIGWDRETPKK
jgi:hypothetical protein